MSLMQSGSLVMHGRHQVLNRGLGDVVPLEVGCHSGGLEPAGIYTFV